MEAPKVGAPKGGAPKGRAPKGGAPEGGGPKISPRHNFLSSFSLAWNFGGV